MTKERRPCPCGAEQTLDNNSWYCFMCGNTSLQVVHKGVTFIQDSKRPNRLNFLNNYVDIPGDSITSLKQYKEAVIIECGGNKFRLVFKAEKDWGVTEIYGQ